jgi:hypothetical protein
VCGLCGIQTRYCRCVADPVDSDTSIAADAPTVQQVEADTNPSLGGNMAIPLALSRSEALGNEQLRMALKSHR